MKNKFKKSLLISILIILLMLSITIYNIAFATDESEEKLNVIEKNDEGTVNGIVYGETIIATYSHKTNDKITDITELVDKLNNKKTSALTDVLAVHDSVFCIRKGQGLPSYSATLVKQHNDPVTVSNYITFSYGSTPTISITDSHRKDYKQNGESFEQTTQSNIQWQETRTSDLKTFSNRF